jgi:hypothetical protein
MKLGLLLTTAAAAPAAFLIGSAGAFSSANQQQQPEVSRRNFFGGAAAAAVTGAALFIAPSEATAAPLGKLPDSSVVQREINSFNDLINNFKDTTLNGGLDASTLKEPSVPFIEFGERMKKGEVAFVEFMAPSGDVVYVTFKPKQGDKGTPEKIRIGQGYPTESKNSWSSPAYVIRSVSNYGVPYKFTVPALAKYKK